MESLGYHRQLDRGVGRFGSFSVAFALISVTTAVYTTFGLGLTTAGPSFLWTFPIALAILGLWVVIAADLASKIPLAGYAYQWTYRLVSSGFGWFTGFFGIFGFVTAMAAVAFTLSGYFGGLAGWDLSTDQAIGLTIVVLALAAVVNVGGVRLVTKLNNVGVSCELVVALGGTLAVGTAAFFIHHNAQSLSFLFTRGVVPSGGFAVAWLTATVTGLFGLLGVEAAADISEETKRATSTVPRMMFLALGTAAVIEFIMYGISMLAIKNISGASASLTPLIYIMHSQLGTGFTDVFVAFALTNLLLCVLANLLVAGRPHRRRHRLHRGRPGVLPAARLPQQRQGHGRAERGRRRLVPGGAAPPPEPRHGRSSGSRRQPRDRAGPAGRLPAAGRGLGINPFGAGRPLAVLRPSSLRFHQGAQPMRFTPRVLASLDGKFRMLKDLARSGPAAQRAPAVAATVSQMLLAIEQRGMDAVLDYAAQLDGWHGGDVLLPPARLARCADALPADLRAAIELGAERTQMFAAAHRARLTDFETELVPGLMVGYRYVPVGRVGAYLPAGQFPLTASAFMTVNVAKSAGVPTVIGCTPPGRDGHPNNAVAYAAHVSGIDRLYILGGVQALAAMAFGLLADEPVDMIVGAGNAYVAEAKRQLFGQVAIDLLAGPSEVAVLADHTADPVMVAADLLGQAEHGPTSPAALVTTSQQLGLAVIDEIHRQLSALDTRDIAEPAWHDYGTVTWVADPGTAITLMDDLAPEHLEIFTQDDAYYHDRLRNYGSVFLGPWSTVAYSDKGMAGTNHVLPTAGGAKHSAGLSVARYLKPLTYQRISRAATPEVANAVDIISASEGMAAHRATATLRLDSYKD